MKFGSLMFFRFRWVVCQLDALRECRTTGQIKKALCQLPTTLDDTYIRILENIDKRSRHFVQDVLNLIAFSKRPLTLREIVEAIAFDADRRCFSEDEKFRDPLEVLEICSSLISLPDTQKSTEMTDSEQKELNNNDFEQEVRFAHFSVKEFLIDDRLSGNQFHISNQEANRLIAERCLIYLLSNLKSIDPQTQNLLQKFPFLRYSARYWYDHVLVDEIQKELKDLIIQLFHPNEGCIFSNWLRIWDPDSEQEMSDKLTRPGQLYYSSMLGLIDVVQLLLDKGAEVNAEGGEYGNALQAASRNGHEAVVRLLLDKGAEVNALGGFFDTALRAALLGSHQAVIRLLLGEGARAGFLLLLGKVAGPMALRRVAERGYKDLGELLLAKGARVSAPGKTGSMYCLDQGIVTSEQAITPNNHPNRATYLSNLGYLVQSRFESMDDLNRAIMANEQAIKLTPDSRPDRARRLSNLGNALWMRFERIGSIDDLNRAIFVNEKAVKLIPEGHPDRVMYMNNLGTTLQSRVERIGSMEDLDRAIMTNKQVVESTPENHPDRVTMLNNLGIALQRQFERTGSMDYIDRAIIVNEKSVKSTPEDHPNRARRLNNMGNALMRRFEQTGSIPDLGRAIRIYEQAVGSSPEIYPDYATILNNLGIVLRRRFEWMGSMEDIDRAIMTNENAVESTPDDHPDRAIYLTNLGISLQSRFDRTGSMEDLERAIVTSEQAVESTPIDHSARVMYLNNLGSTLQSRFERMGLMDDLNRAILTSEQAVELTPVDRPDRAMYLNNLGTALQSRYERTGSMDDLDRAIMTNEQAVESTPEGHPAHAMYLNNLATALQRRFERTGSIEDLDRAITTTEQAFKSDTAPPSVRLKAASSCSDMLISQKSYNRAKAILQTAVQLLTTIGTRLLRCTDQQLNISQFSSITSRAVSLHLAVGEDAYKALQLSELGRGIIANLLLEVRSDISLLDASHPDLAQQFLELRNQLDPPARTFELSVIEGSSSTYNSMSNLNSSKFIAGHHAYALAKQFDDLLRYIRSLEGFENFLQFPSESELHSLAEDGPIILFNVSDIRSDAFLITSNEIRSVRLPLLTADLLEKYADLFLYAIDEFNIRRYQYMMLGLNRVLEWLWDVAVEPVLDELGFSQAPLSDETWPRVWWVGGGLMSLLPIHASGYHDVNPPKTALDRVISSYAPTLKSLIYARDRAEKACHISKEKALLVAMSEGSPYVEMEVRDLERLLDWASIDTTIMHNPTRAEVLSEMQKSTIVHFACGASFASDPSQSVLHLKDWKSHPLTASDLASLNIELGKLAYLSVSHASTMRDFHLLDESINLSSAIQLSGYSSVMGSLWKVQDAHSAKVARDIYAWMLKGQKLNVRQSAEGLHKAIRDLRDMTRFKTKSDPLAWAPYIYIGI